MRRLLLLTLLTVACTEDEEIPIGFAVEGEACGRVADCVAGLDCLDGTCVPIDQPDVTGRAGSPCTGDGECREDLCCGNQGVCRAPTGGGGCGFPEGTPCGLAADCDVGLICDGSGTCVTPGTGTGEGAEGDGCQEIADCRRPLICGADDTCQPPPFFPGVDCTRSEEDLGAFRGYFEVPREEPLAEFYRQPFPSDVRLVDGRIDLTGHPDPGEVGGVDFAALYLRAIEEDYDGFGLTQPVFFRFSDPLDESTLVIDGPDATIFLADTTTGERVPIQLQYRRDKSQFLCASALAVAPVDGVALSPRTTYALVVTTGVKSFKGETPIQDGDLAAILADATPDDTHLARAQAAFLPLDGALGGLPKEEIALASVFSTGDPGAAGPMVYDAVQAAPAPELLDPVLCAGGATSPCAENGERDCPEESAAFVQIHGKVTSPVLQRGTRPYALAGDGTEGAFLIDGDGIALQGTEEICVAIAVPSGAMPSGGWPILVYGHGTGGNFLSGMGQVAEDMAAEGIAVISFDGNMHGPRQGLPPAGRQDPGRLFFNARNPRAARDNVLQGAADLHNLVRLMKSLELTDAGVGVTARFDPDRIMYFGHSQGTVVGAPFFIHNPDLSRAVFSGAGAEIGLTMVHKRRPNDVAALTRAIFGDQTVTRLHPMLGLMSLFFGPSDAIPYAGLLSDGRIDFLHVYGRNDGFTPDVTQDALVRAGGYPLVGEVLVPISRVSEVQSPAAGNLGGATVGAIQFEPPIEDGELLYDGHFVGSRDAAARASIANFLSEGEITR